LTLLKLPAKYWYNGSKIRTVLPIRLQNMVNLTG
jgi:hypothetical protein